MSFENGYREMKDSGVPWIGEIPSDWSVLRGKRVLRLLERTITKEDEIITCFRDGEVTLRKNRREDGFTIAEKEIGYQGIEPDDLVVHGMDGFAGAIGISDSRGKATPVLLVLDSEQNKKYLMYYLRSMAYSDVFMGISSGIRVRSCALNWKKLAELPFPIPSIKEQEKIVKYIDAKFLQIDSMLSEAKANIEDYKVLKQSVIAHAVTKGLDPDAEMKDSGVKWIGKMPKHWKTVNPKALFSQRKDRAKRGENQLTASQEYGVISQNEYMELTGSKVVLVAKDFDILKHVEAGDFVISMRSFQGGLEYSTQSGSISSAYVMLIPNKELVVPEFYKWLLKSLPYIEALRSTSNLVRDGQAMRYFNFVKVPLYLVPLNEQREIADYLNVRCTQIDNLIAEQQALIDDLEAAKKSLIYECVTGKRKI